MKLARLSCSRIAMLYVQEVFQKYCLHISIHPDNVSKWIKSIKYSSDYVICVSTSCFLVAPISIDTIPRAINKFFWTCWCRIFWSTQNHFAIAIWTSLSQVKRLLVRCSWYRWLAFHFRFIVMHQTLILYDSVQKIFTLTSVAREYSLTCFHSAVFILGISWRTHRAHFFCNLNL